MFSRTMTVFAVFFFLWDFDAVVATWIGVWNSWAAEADNDEEEAEEAEGAEEEDEDEDDDDSSASNSWGRS